jgi:hypothetical protein
MLVAAEDEGAGVDARQVRDEVMTMLLAGHETSAAALTWTWHLLARHPEAAEAVRDEATRVLAGRTAPEAQDLARLEVTEAVLQETMRLYPPVPWFGRLYPPVPWFGRLAAGPDRIGGHAIPAGAILALSPWLVQRDPRLWPEPEPLRSGPVRSWGRAAGALHLVPLRRRAAHLPRQPLRHDRDAGRLGGAGAAVPPPPCHGRAGPAGAAGDAAAGRRAADAGRASFQRRQDGGRRHRRSRVRKVTE